MAARSGALRPSAVNAVTIAPDPRCKAVATRDCPRSPFPYAFAPAGAKLVRMPKHPLAVFLPAAGLGERLRPVTNHLPKPLLPILGKPIIERILERLTAVCDGTIGINLHWKADLLRAWAGTSRWRDRIVFFP